MNKRIDKTDILSKILAGRSFTVDVFQREYRWGKKQVEQMIDDLQNCFDNYYDPDKHDTPEEVAEYGYYFLGHILCVTGPSYRIVDGQQRLTTLTLLLIYLNNLQKEQAKPGDPLIQFGDLIYHDHFGKKIFNINVPEREACFQALYNNNMKAKLDTDKEIFIRVERKSYVDDERDGFWEKGMTSIPMVAYKLNDQSTHKKVREQFGYKE